MFIKLMSNIKPTIRKDFLKKIEAIPGLTLPVALDFKDEAGVLRTQVILDTDGVVTDIQSGYSYGSPSECRAALLEENIDTYIYFFYQGTSLHDLGVCK